MQPGKARRSAAIELECSASRRHPQASRSAAENAEPASGMAVLAASVGRRVSDVGKEMVRVRAVIEPGHTDSLVSTNHTCGWWKSWHAADGCNRRWLNNANRRAALER